MSVLTQHLRNQHRTRDNALLTASTKATTQKAETAWCAITLVLFLALGPFAAVPALFSVLSLIPGGETNEPESVGE
jgi:hypothetical protein